MGDATRPPGDAAEQLAAARAEMSGLVGELTHIVLGLFRARGIVVAERITVAGGHPFEVIDVFVVTLRALADGLEEPGLDSLEG
jgi:hypothetical protein